MLGPTKPRPGQLPSCMDLSGALGAGVDRISQGSLVEELTCEKSLKECMVISCNVILVKNTSYRGIK